MESRYPRTIMATVCIPWDEKYAFEQDVFVKQLKILISCGITHIYVFGTAGEGYAVSESQFREIVSVFASETAGAKVCPMAGIISLSAVTVLERIQYAYSCGIRDFQISFPSWGVLSDTEVKDFFHLILDPFPDCRFMHYNNSRTGRMLTIPEYEELADEFANLAAVKYMFRDFDSLNKISRSSCPIRFFVGEEAFGAIGAKSGCGLLMTMSSMNPSLAHDFFDSVLSEDKRKVDEYIEEFSLMRENIVKKGKGSGIDGAYDKMYCRMLDPGFPLRLLPPYAGCTEERYEEYLRFVRNKHPRWLIKE